MKMWKFINRDMKMKTIENVQMKELDDVKMERCEKEEMNALGSKSSNHFIFKFSNLLAVLGIMTCSVLIGVQGVRAQSWKDILNSSKVKDVVNAVTGNVIKFADMQGNWNYVEPACKMTSENILQEAGGTLMSSTMEKKMTTVYTKLGIVPGKFSYTFNSDSTFTNMVGKRTLQGKYSLDEKNRVLTLEYKLANTITIKRVEVQLEKSGDQVSLLFNVDGLMKFVKTLSSMLKKSDSASMFDSLMEGYDGLLLGFEMKKN